MPSFGRSTTLVGGGGGGSIGGSGTAGRLAKFTAGTTLGDSLLSESGQDVTINTGRLVINRGTITALSPALDVTTTWNNAAVTFTGLRYNVTDTASNAASLLLDLQVGGVSQARFDKAGNLVVGDGTFAATSICSIGRKSDPDDGIILGETITFVRDSIISATLSQSGSSCQLRLNASAAAGAPLNSGNSVQLSTNGSGVLEQVFGATAQTFNIYNTFTSSTNHELGFLSWVSNEFRIGTEKGSGGGSARDIVFYRDGAERARINSGGLRIATSSVVQWGSSRSYIYSPADGNIGLSNAAGTAFGLLQFGGTTSSFPALKRSSATLQCRLADDSAFANLQGKLTTDTNYTGGAPTPTGYLVVYDAAGTAYKIPAEAV